MRSRRPISHARASGFPHARHLWGEAMSQVAFGWPADPAPFDSDGNLRWSDLDAVNVAFRFPEIQGEKIRTRDDFKYGLFKLRAADFAPIGPPPACGRISQIATDLSVLPREWSFTKRTARRPIRTSRPTLPKPDIALRRSDLRAIPDGLVPPRALLVGSAAEVRHYKCFPRIAAAITHRLFGLP